MNVVEITTVSNNTTPRCPQNPPCELVRFCNNKGKPQYKQVVSATMLKISSPVSTPMMSATKRIRPSKSAHKLLSCFQITNSRINSIPIPVIQRKAPISSLSADPKSRLDKPLIGFVNHSTCCLLYTSP